LGKGCGFGDRLFNDEGKESDRAHCPDLRLLEEVADLFEDE
jgi:hypothetical protein